MPLFVPNFFNIAAQRFHPENVMIKRVLFLLLRSSIAVVLGTTLFAGVWALLMLPSTSWNMVSVYYSAAVESGRLGYFIFTLVSGVMLLILFIGFIPMLLLLTVPFFKVIGWNKPADNIWEFFD